MTALTRLANKPLLRDAAASAAPWIRNLGGGGGGASDPLLPNVRLNVNFTGTAGAGNADCVDLSPSPKTLTYMAATDLSATDDAGNNIGQYLKRQTGAITTSGHTGEWEIGDADFCIEFFFRRELALWNIVHYYLSAGSTAGWYIYIGRDPSENGELRLIHNATNLGGVRVRDIYTPEQWHHIAITRSGSDLRFFFDGTQQGAAHTITATLDANNKELTLNGVIPTVASDSDLDQVRVTIGDARYTSDFTPPTEDYPTT